MVGQLKVSLQGRTGQPVVMRFAEAVADQVLFLEDGVVVEQGTPEQFFHAPQTERAQQFLKSFTYTFRKSEVQSKNNSGD